MPTATPLIYHLDDRLRPVGDVSPQGIRGHFLETSDGDLQTAMRDPLEAKGIFPDDILGRIEALKDQV